MYVIILSVPNTMSNNPIVLLNYKHIEFETPNVKLFFIRFKTDCNTDAFLIELKKYLAD